MRSGYFSKFTAWTPKKSFWCVLFLFILALLLISRYGFQEWLRMKPCVLCVQIRFGFTVALIGAFLCIVGRKILGNLGFLVTEIGLIYTAIQSDTLCHIKAGEGTIKACTNTFGIPKAEFPFGLPLDSWLPQLYKATASSCGNDAPILIPGPRFGAVKNYLLTIYQEADGWYLIPQWSFLNMAQCCLIIALVLCVLVFVNRLQAN